MSDPSIPLALRRLRHVEYFALISRGSFASNAVTGSSSSSSSSNPSSSAATHKKSASTISSAAEDAASSAATSSSSSSSSWSKKTFKHFFPDDRSCCRMELLLPAPSSSTSSQPHHQNDSSASPSRPKVIYRSEPIAPTRHPRFAPISADVRHFGGAAETVLVRVLAETLNHGHNVCAVVEEQKGEEGQKEEENSRHRHKIVHLDFRSDSSFAAAMSVLRKPAAAATSSQHGKRPSTSTGVAAQISDFFQEDDDEDDDGYDEDDHYCEGEEQAGNDTISEPRTMVEIPICFSKLEYVAEHLSDATEIIREKLKQSDDKVGSTQQQQQQQQQRGKTPSTSSASAEEQEMPMECLVVCSDGVFRVPSYAAASSSSSLSQSGTTTVAAAAHPPHPKRLGAKEPFLSSSSIDHKDDDTASTTSTVAAAAAGTEDHHHADMKNSHFSELLKQVGSETSSSFGGGSPTSKPDQGGWEVVAASHDPDKINETKVRSFVTSTLTMHYAEVLLKRRALLEKERLVKDMHSQLHQGDDEKPHGGTMSKPTEDGAAAAAADASSSSPLPSSSSTTSVRQQLTNQYRTMLQEDIRRQIESVRSQVTQQETVASMLQEQLRGRKVALEGRRRDLEQRTKACEATKDATAIDRFSASILEKQLRLCRNKVLAGMQRIFPITTVAPHSICGFNIPHNEPQNEEHACALGCIVHAVTTFCSVHGHVPLHPLISQTSRSCVAEFVGAPPSKVFPLYATNATEREQSTRAVMLLRRVMAHAAFSIHNQRQASDLPFGIALQKLLFNR